MDTHGYKDKVKEAELREEGNGTPGCASQHKHPTPMILMSRVRRACTCTVNWLHSDTDTTLGTIFGACQFSPPFDLGTTHSPLSFHPTAYNRRKTG